MDDATRERLARIREWVGGTNNFGWPDDMRWLCDQLEAALSAGTFADGVEACVNELKADLEFPCRETKNGHPCHICDWEYRMIEAIRALKPTPPAQEPRCKHCAIGLKPHRHDSDGTWGHEFREGGRAWCDPCETYHGESTAGGTGDATGAESRLVISGDSQPATTENVPSGFTKNCATNDSAPAESAQPTPRRYELAGQIYQCDSPYEQHDSRPCMYCKLEKPTPAPASVQSIPPEVAQLIHGITLAHDYCVKHGYLKDERATAPPAANAAAQGEPK